MILSNNYSFDTLCVHGAYRARGGEPQNVPIVQSTTYRFDSCAEVAAMFDLTSENHMYTRISNPTVEQLEKKAALLEGGTAAVATSSGQAATLVALLNICEAGDHILCSTNVYGGTHNLIGVSFAKLGISSTFLPNDSTVEQIVAAARPQTKALVAETLANPALTVLDFETWSAAAREIGVPLIVDNTLATPFLCRPLEHGADIVICSTSKYFDGNASSLGGMVIDGGSFDWAASGKFPCMTEPDESYHGLVYTKSFPDRPFAVKARGQLVRDFGCCQNPMNAYNTLTGMETLHLRMPRHSASALRLAEFLENHPKVAWVNYPGLKSNPCYPLACKYLPKGQSGILTFGVKGGLAAGQKLIESFELTSLVVHLGDVRTCVLHPGSTTHRQLSEAEQAAAGVPPELIRVSAGLEDPGDLIADFDAALARL